MRRGAGEAGFTLVEALAALAILSAVMVATYAALTGALAVASRADARRAAVAAIEWQVDQLRGRGLVQAGTVRGTSGPYRWQVRAEPLPTAAGSLLRPLRIMGRIQQAQGDAAETVLDTVILGRAR